MDAKDLIDDINTTGTPGGSVERVERWLACGGSTYIYLGSPTDPPAFELEQGVGYWVKAAADTDYVITGTHDPGHVHTFRGALCGGTGTNFFAPPYHSIAANAKELIDDINANGVPPNSVERLEYWLTASNARLLYAGSPTDGAAPLFTQGEAVFVKVGAGDVRYAPTHY